MLVDIFRPIPRETRRENLAAYHQFLVARDGEMDLEKRQLSLREKGMAKYERPLARVRDMDQDLFRTQYESFDPKAKIPPETLLLLALVKINAAEAYGVNTSYETVLRRAIKNDDSAELILLCEETYHTRILLSTALSYGLEIKSAYKPPTALRALIATIGATPVFFSRPLVLASEVLAVLMFLNLLEKSRAVLKHDAELRDAVEERLCEIITDELGHMSFNRACIGSAGMAQAKMLLPMVAVGMSGAFPEMSALGTMSSASGDEVTSLTTGSRLPAHVVRQAFLA
jgi:hypothetical protein